MNKKNLFLFSVLLLICGCRPVSRDNTVTPEQGENGKYGYVDKAGKAVIPFEYGYAGPFGELNLDGLSLVCTEAWSTPYTARGKCGMVNKQGEWVVPLVYGCILQASDGLAAVNDGEYVDTDSSAVGTRTGKWGFIDEKGKLVIPLQYDEVGNFYNEVCFANKGGRWGMISKTGAEVLPFEFDRLTYSESGDSIKAQTQEEIFWTDLRGKRL